MASDQARDVKKIRKEAVISVKSHSNKESWCNFDQPRVHNSDCWKLPRGVVSDGPAWSGMVRLLRRFSGKEVVDVLKEKLKA